MAIKQLLGRGTYGPTIVTGPGISPLWQFFLPPPNQNSVIIYNDGTVVERATFENSEIKDPSVFLFILGGCDFRCTDDSFAYQALTDAGYTWRDLPDQDTYGEIYESSFTLEWNQANQAVIESRKEAADVAAQQYLLEQRIAGLQAEINALEQQIEDL